MKPRGGVRKSDGDTPTWSDNPASTPCPTCTYGDDGKCIYCGHNAVLDGLEEDGHCDDDNCEGGCCCTPLDFNWGAMLFMMILAAGYAVRAKMREKCTVKE